MSAVKGDLKKSLTSFKKKSKKIDEKIESFTDIYKAEDYVRSLPFSLSKKRQILETNPKIKELRKKERKYNTTYHIQKPFNTVKARFAKIRNYFSPFKSRIDSVEKHLGLDVASYFNLNYWLIYHNVVVFGLTLFPFLCIPHIIMLSYNAMGKIKLKGVDTLNVSCSDYNIEFQAIDILVGNVISA